MTQHYTRNTVSAMAWCGKCGRQTEHRIDGVKRGPCLECGKDKPELVLKPNSVEWPAPCTCDKYPFAHYHGNS